MATNQGFKSLVPDAARVDVEFLAYWLAGHTAYLQSFGTGATFKEISKSVVMKIEIPLPPLDEQRRIARVLDACDLLLRKRQHTVEVSGELVQALFAETSVRHGNSAALPLAELVASNRPITYGILKPGPHVPDGVPYVRVIDIQDGEIRTQVTRRTTSEIAAQYRRSVLTPGDLVMSIRGHVGRLGVIPQGLAGGNITQDSARLAIRDHDARYVMEAIRSAPVQAWIRRRIKGVAVQGINLADVKMIPIPQVSIGAQREFSARAAGCDRVLARARAQLRHLDALFASLQHRAFTGAL
jgi:type I restriction enzyme S subunit